MDAKPHVPEPRLPAEAPAAATAKAVARNGQPAHGPSERAPALRAVNIRHLLLAVVTVAGFAELAYAIVNVSAMPVYIKYNGLDIRWIGLIGTAYLVVEGVLKSPFGVLGDRIGRKPLILIGPIMSTFTAIATPFVHSPYGLVGLRVLDGIGAAALWPSAFSLIGDYVPEKKRASAMSLFNLAYILGIALGPAIGGNINDWTYYHFHHILHMHLAQSKDASFYVASLLFLTTTFVAMLVIPNGRVKHPVAEGAPSGEAGFNFRDFLAMLGRMPMTLLMTFVTFLGIGLIMLYVKVFAMERFHMSESTFGNYLMIPALFIAVVSVPLGTLGDRIGKARAVRIGIGVCVAAFWLLLAVPTEWNMVLMGSLIGAGFVLAFPAWMALVSSVCDPKQRGAVVGAVGTAQGLGAIVGAASSGFLYKQPAFHLGLLTIPPHGLPFLGCALLLTVSLVLALTTVHDPDPSQCDPPSPPRGSAYPLSQ